MSFFGFAAYTSSIYKFDTIYYNSFLHNIKTLKFLCVSELNNTKSTIIRAFVHTNHLPITYTVLKSNHKRVVKRVTYPYWPPRNGFPRNRGLPEVRIGSFNPQPGSFSPGSFLPESFSGPGPGPGPGPSPGPGGFSGPPALFGGGGGGGYFFGGGGPQFPAPVNQGASQSGKASGGGFNMDQIKSFVDRMGGIDGIVGTVGKVQKIVSSFQQVAPMLKLLFNSFGSKASTNNKRELSGQSSRRRKKRGLHSGQYRTYRPYNSKKKKRRQRSYR